MGNTQLHLLIPGLLGPMSNVDELGTPPESKLFQQLIARADKRPYAGCSYESTLFHLFGIQSDNQNYPLAAINRFGDGQPVDSRYWFQLNPVYLRPDQERLLLFDTLDLNFTLAESKALARLFSEHFRDEGWQLEVVTPHRWYLAISESVDIKTYSIEDVYGRGIDRYLPQGVDALHWHGILNEVQMLFHSSEVNRVREEAGKLPINGLWLSGGGVLPKEVTAPYSMVWSDCSLAWGLAGLSGIGHDCRPATLDHISGENTFVIYEELMRPVWRSDPFDWYEALSRLETWIGPLINRFIDKSASNLLSIYPCDGSVYRITKNKRRRFWRKKQKLTDLLSGTVTG